MRRAAIIVVVALALGLLAAVAGAAGPRVVPVPYAHGSEYVYSGSGQKVGTLTGSGLGTQLNVEVGQVSR